MIDSNFREAEMAMMRQRTLIKANLAMQFIKKNSEVQKFIFHFRTISLFTQRMSKHTVKKFRFITPKNIGAGTTSTFRLCNSNFFVIKRTYVAG